MEIKKLDSPVSISDSALVRLKEMGNITEIMYSEKRSRGGYITKIDKDHYVDNRTGELFEFKHLENRAQDQYEVYLNIAEWGPLIYGIQEASAYYFNKRPSQLTTEESIFLASIIPKPKHFRSSFAENGKLKESMEGYYKLIAGRLAQKGLISEIEADTIRPEIQVTGDALNSLAGKTPESSSPTAEEQ